MDAGRPLRSLKSRALQLLAQREHSRAELRRKLAAHAGRIGREAQHSPFADAGAAIAASDGRGSVTPPRDADPADIDPASRARQSRFLAGRGFSAEVIARLMREARRACNDGQTQPEDD